VQLFFVAEHFIPNPHHYTKLFLKTAIITTAAQVNRTLSGIRQQGIRQAIVATP
jgi:hypothetical protein